jgi:hypothetical protein
VQVVVGRPHGHGAAKPIVLCTDGRREGCSSVCRQQPLPSSSHAADSPACSHTCRSTTVRLPQPRRSRVPEKSLARSMSVESAAPGGHSCCGASVPAKKLNLGGWVGCVKRGEGVGVELRACRCYA